MILEGKVAVVFGGANGMGRAYCEGLLQEKAKVCCTDIMEPDGRRTERELQQVYGRESIVFRWCNAADEQQIKDSVVYAKKHFGRLDIVINTVGIADEINWPQAVHLNLGTTIMITNAAIEVIGKQSGGCGGVVAHTVSMAGLSPQFFDPVYSAAKGAMISYIRAMSHDVNYEQHGLRMFGVCPTITNTNFLKTSLAANRIIKKELLESMIDFNDTEKMFQPADIAKVMIATLKDDSARGVAVEITSKEASKMWFQGETQGVAIKQKLDTVK